MAISLVALAASQLSFAQTTPADDSANAKADASAPIKKTKASAKSDNSENPDGTVVLDTYRVTGGFAGSLAAAAETKQQIQTITEVIAAEDIGKLPDISIADSLTRLTGITTQRTNGRSQQIDIRGLGPDFSTATLNGLQQVTTNDNRGVEFDQYPAELLSGVIVYKTASADIIGQGLAGTVDLQTVKPLAVGQRKVSVGAYYDWTQLPRLTPGLKKDGEHYHASYIDQFDNGKIGISLGFAHTSTPYEGEQFQAWGYPTDSSGNYVLGGTKSYVRTSVLDRNAFMGTLEFKPNENIHSTVDFYHTNFKENQLLRGMEIPLAVWSSAQLQPGYTVTNGLVTQATLTNVMPVNRNDTFVRTDNLSSLDWNLQLAPALSGGVEWVGSGGSPVWDVAPSGDAIFSLRPTEASALTLAARFTRSWSAFGVQSAMTAGLGYAVRVGKVELRPEVTFSYLTGGRGEFFELYPSLTVAGAAR